MEYFLIRSKPSGIVRENQFIEGIVSMGWPDTGNLENCNKHEIIRRLSKSHPKKATPHSATQILNFINMQVGTFILTPSIKDTSKVHVLEVIEEYCYLKKWVAKGNPHVIGAAFIKTMDKSEFSEKIQKAIRACRRTITSLAKYSEEIHSTVMRGEVGETVEQPEPEKSATVPEDRKAIVRPEIEEHELSPSEVEEEKAVSVPDEIQTIEAAPGTPIVIKIYVKG